MPHPVCLEYHSAQAQGRGGTPTAKLDAESGVTTQTVTLSNHQQAVHTAPGRVATCTRHSVSTQRCPNTHTHTHTKHKDETYRRWNEGLASNFGRVRLPNGRLIVGRSHIAVGIGNHIGVGSVFQCSVVNRAGHGSRWQWLAPCTGFYPIRSCGQRAQGRSSRHMAGVSCGAKGASHAYHSQGRCSCSSHALVLTPCSRSHRVTGACLLTPVTRRCTTIDACWP